MKQLFFIAIAFLLISPINCIGQKDINAGTSAARIDFKELRDNDSSKHKENRITAKGMEIIPAGAAEDQWYTDGEGAFFYKELSGDFLLETEVSIFRLDGTDELPKAHFSSAGLLVKKSTYTKGNACWVMYNIGFQAGFWGREFKVTRPHLGSDADSKTENPASLSTLKLIPATHKEYTKLRLARVGGEFRSYYQNDNGEWLENNPDQVTATYGSGKLYPVEKFDDEFLRPTDFCLEDVVHVGIITNPGMNPDSQKFQDTSVRDAGARFKYFIIREIAGFDEALRSN